MRIRRSAATAVTAMAILCLGATTASASTGASPSTAATGSGEIQPMNAQGCTLYPGSGASSACATIAGEDLTVFAISITHFSAGNVCNPVSQFRGTRTNGVVETVTRQKTGCMVGSSGNRWDNPGVYKRGTQLCARQKDSATNNEYGAWICNRIG